VALKDIPDALNDLAEVEMHAIQTSGNCIRNVTSDHFAGAAADEVMDPRPWCEIIRQWSTFHPEFAFLPRKFKFAVTAAAADRAAIAVHDIGLRIVKRGEQVGFEVYVGGGQGRTPLLAALVNDFVPETELLDYVEAIMRVYNRYGRRDNKYKARIKILVAELGQKSSRARWKLNMPPSAAREDRPAAAPRSTASMPISPRRPLTPKMAPKRSRPPRPPSPICPVGGGKPPPAQAGGPCLRHRQPEADRRRGGRCDGSSDGNRCRPRRALRL
jgi:sulfite reductase beta subunit-like hemoprotein